MKNLAVKFLGLLMIALTIGSVGCKDDDFVQPNEKLTSNEMIAIPFFVVDENGSVPSNPTSPLFDVRKQNPVIAPDGHQVTWAEYSDIRGTMTSECTASGNKVSLDVEGLIPNGIYTIWNVTVKAPGFDPSMEGFNVTGIGAAGKGDGSDNRIQASANGEISITLTSPGGPMSMFGNIGACPMTDEYEWHLVGAYHIDGQTYGGDLGPDGTVCVQFAFIYNSESK